MPDRADRDPVGDGRTGEASSSGSASAFGTDERKQVHYRIASSLIPLFSQLEMKVNWKLTVAGFAVEFLQLIGLLLNGHFNWGPVFGDIIARVVYFFNLPFIDPWWNPNTYIVVNVFFWVYFAVLTLMTCLYAYYVTRRYKPVDHRVASVGKVLIHGLASVGLLPVALTFTGFIVCDKSAEVMFWMPQNACLGAYHSAYMACAVIGLLMMTLWCYVAAEFLFEDSFVTTSLGARACSGPVTCTTLLKIAAAILFNVLLSKGLPEVLSPTLLALFVLNAAQYAIVLPYYKLNVTRWRVASLLVYATFAGVATANIPATSMWHTRSLSTIVVLVTSVVMFTFGWFAAQLRLNRRYLHTARNLQRTSVSTAEPCYPRGLPINDAIFSRYPDVEKLYEENSYDLDISLRHPSNPFSTPAGLVSTSPATGVEMGMRRRRHQNQQRDHAVGGSDAEMAQLNVAREGQRETADCSILDPYLVSVFLLSDVEAATRFMQEFSGYSGMAPTAKMRMFAARIYVKGQVKFRGNVRVAYFFAMFLATHGSRVRHALFEVENYVERLEMSMTRYYHVSRLVNMIKVTLNMSDMLQTQTIATSTRLHKDVLRITASFWARLLAVNVDIEQLGRMADHITKRREECRKSFNRALLQPNQAVLVRYARFLDNVLMEPEAAKILKDRVTEVGEARRLEVMTAVRSGGSVATGADDHGTYQQILEYVHKNLGNVLSVKGIAATAVKTLYITVSILFVLLILIVIALLVYMLLHGNEVKLLMNRLWAAGLSRTLVAYISFYAAEVKYMQKDDTPNWELIQAAKAELASLADELFEMHNSLMQESLMSSLPLIAKIYSTSRVEVVEPGIVSLSGSFTRTVTDVFQLGSRVILSARVVARTPEGTMAPSSALDFLVLNGQGPFATAFNGTFPFYFTYARELKHNFRLVFSILGFSALVLLFIVSATISVYFNKVETAKQATLNLFRLIPRSYVEQLYKANQDRVDHFDKEEREVALALDNVDMGEPASGTAHVLYGESRGRRTQNSSIIVSRTGSHRDGDGSSGVATSAMDGSRLPPRGLDHAAVSQSAGTASWAMSGNRMDTYETRRSSNWTAEKDDEKSVGNLRYAGTLEDDETVPLNALTTSGTWCEMTSSTQTFSVAISVSLVFATLLLLAALGVNYELYRTTQEVGELSHRRRSAYKLSSDFRKAVDDLTFYSQQYIATGDVVHVINYTEVLSSSRPYEIQRDHMQLELDPVASALLVDRMTLFDSMVLRQSVGMWLASIYYVVDYSDLPVFDRAYAIRKPYDFIAMQPAVEEVFASVDLIPSPAPATTDSSDILLPSDRQFEIANSLLFDDTYQEHFRLLSSISTRLHSDIMDSTRSLVEKQMRLWVFAIILYGSAGILALLVGVIYLLFKGRLIICFPLSLGIISIVMMITVLAAQQTYTTMSSEAADAEIHFNLAMNSTTAVAFSNQRVAMAYSQFGELKRRNEWFAWTTSADMRTAFYEALEKMHSAVNKVVLAELMKSVIALFEANDKLNYLALISLTLSSVLFGTYGDKDLPGSSKLRNFKYNRVLESMFASDVAIFQWAPTIYTNKKDDIAKDEDELKLITKNTLSGERYSFVSNPSFAAIGLYRENTTSIIHEKVLKRHDAMQITSIVSIALSASVAVLFVIVLLAAVHTALWNRAANGVFTFRRETRKSANGAVRMSSSSSRAMIIVNVFLFVVDLILIAMVTVAFYSAPTTEGNARNLNLATSREWLVLELMLRVQQVWYDSPIDATVTPYINDVRKAFSDLVEERSNFYLGSAHGTTGVLSTISLQAGQLFGSAVFAGLQFSYPCSPTPPTSGKVSLMQIINEGIPITDEVINQLFSGGVEDVVWQWTFASSAMVRTSLTNQGSYRDTFLAIVPHLYSRLRASSMEYRSTIESSRSVLERAFIVLASVLIGTLLLILLMVMRPIIEHLRQQSNGTVALLKMIPEEVQRDVPELLQFFETGTLDEKMEKINAACNEATAVATIVIDSECTVIQISREALQCFQYTSSEVIGKNVNMLMPEDVAAQHDRYVRRYQHTGVGQVVNCTRRLLAKRKDGTTFPINLTVREVQMSNEKSFFVGRVRSIAAEVELEKVKAIQTCLQNTSRIPIVVTDAMGGVKVINDAACSMFQYNREEMIGRNVKRLMPDRFARLHDQYFTSYYTHRMKVAVGNTRRIIGRRKNGEEIQLETTIRELVDNQGNPLMFVSYLRDITSDLVAAQSLRASEAAIQMSPIPVIGMDTAGIINAFSPAAEQTWGWQASEIIGQNVNILMNEEDGSQHNTLLAEYMKKGIKHLIDGTRIVAARRKNGEDFFVEASMKELRKDDQITFCGFLRDLTKELEVERRNMLSRSIFHASPVPIIVVDELAIVAEFSPAAELQLGYKAEDVVGRNVKMLLPDAIAEKHDGFFQRYLATGVKTVIDANRQEFAKRADGQLVMVELAVREMIMEDILSDTGKRRMFVGYLRDLTEELQMRKTNEMDDVVINLCVVPMISMTSTGIIRTFNRAAEQEFGYAAEDVVGKNITIIMPSKIARKHDRYLKNYKATGKSKFVDGVNYTFGRRSDGLEFPVEVRVREIRKTELLESIFVGSVLNISERVKVDNAVFMEKALINAYPYGIVTTNVKGRIFRFSDEAERIFGWSEEEILGKNVKILVPPEIEARHDALMQNFVQAGGAVVSIPRLLRGQRKDGVVIDVEITLHIVRRRLKGLLASSRLHLDGDIFVVSFIRDMTSEIMLKRSQELKDAIVKKSMHPIIQFHKNGTIISANDAFLVEFKYPNLACVEGKSIDTLVKCGIAKDYDRFILENIGNRRLLSNGFTQLVDCSLTRSDGTAFPSRAAIRTLRVSNEEAPVVIAFIMNVHTNVHMRTRCAIGDVVINASPAPLFTFTVDGTITRFNKAAQQLFGYTEEEVRGRSITDLQPSEVALLFMDHLRRSALLPEGGPRVSTLTTTAAAVDSRSSQEADMHESAADASKLNRVIDSEGMEKEVMTAAATVALELSPLTGPPHRKKTVPRAVSSSGEPVAVVDSVCRNSKMCTYAARKDGTVFHVEFSAHLLDVAADGELLPTFLAYAKEMTGVVKATLAKEVLSAVSTLSTEAVIGGDSMGRLRIFSARAEEMFGFQAADIIGEPVEVILDPMSVALYREAINRLDSLTSSLTEVGGASRVESNSVRLQLKRHDGSVFPANIRLATFHAGTPSYMVVGLVRDLTTEVKHSAAVRMNMKIIDLLNDAFIVINEVGIMEEVNSSVVRMFGFTRDQLIGRNVKLLMPHQIAANHDHYLQAYLETGQRHIIGTKRRVIVRHKDGMQFPVELRISEAASESIGRRAYYGILRDCREEEQLAFENGVCDLVADMNGKPVISLNAFGNILRLSKSATTLFGHTAEEMKNHHINVIVPYPGGGEGGTVARHPIESLMSVMRETNRNVGEITIRARHKDGTTFECVCTVRVGTVIGGVPTYIALFDAAILQTKSTVIANYAAAINGLSLMAMLHSDNKGSVLSVNAAAQALFGYTANELVGLKLNTLLPAKYGAGDNEDWTATLAMRESATDSQPCRVVAKKKCGAEQLVDVIVVAIASENAGSSFLCFIHDLTSQIAIESSKQLTKTLLALTPSPIFVVRADGVVVAASAAAVEELGMQSDAIIGHPFTDVVKIVTDTPSPLVKEPSTRDDSAAKHPEVAFTAASVSARVRALKGDLISLPGVGGGTPASTLSGKATRGGELSPGTYNIQFGCGGTAPTHAEPSSGSVAASARKMTVFDVVSSDSSPNFVCFVTSRKE